DRSIGVSKAVKTWALCARLRAWSRGDAATSVVPHAWRVGSRLEECLWCAPPHSMPEGIVQGWQCAGTPHAWCFSRGERGPSPLADHHQKCHHRHVWHTLVCADVQHIPSITFTLRRP